MCGQNFSPQSLTAKCRIRNAIWRNGLSAVLPLHVQIRDDVVRYLALAITKHGVEVASARVTLLGLAHELPYN
jgi:hypothetical protein